MSHADKIASALKLIEEHNANLDSPEDKLNTEWFTKKLKKAGGTTEAALRECTWEDLENCGLPRILARNVAKIFRSEPQIDHSLITADRAAGMHPLYLLQSYNPQDPKSAVAKRLHELSRGNKFIVFKHGSTKDIDAANSNKLLQEIIRGSPAREEFEIEPGKFVRTFAVGQSVGESVDENPLYPGRPLRDDGFCDQTNRSWDGVPLSVRQLVYIAIGKQGTTIDKAHDILDIAVSPDADMKLRQRYAKFAAQLDELIEMGQAPVLKIKLIANGGRPNDPFFSNHRKF